MINFMLPGIYENFYNNKIFIDYFYNYREQFYENINLYCVYGRFPWCIWDGGRIFQNSYQASFEEIMSIKEYYESKNLKMRFTYTNPVIEENHLKDRFSNLVTEYCENDNNEIVINSSLLKNYLKETYPSYSFISSTTKRLNNFNEVLNELKNNDYLMVCLDYDLNNNFTFLKSIPNELKEKCEFLINPICPPGCLERKNHYRLNGLYQLSYGKKYAISCGIECNSLHPVVQQYKTTISPEAIQTTYQDLGFTNFKIEGRTFNGIQLFGIYAYYLAKPEYRMIVYHNLIEDFLKYNYPDKNYIKEK